MAKRAPFLSQENFGESPFLLEAGNSLDDFRSYLRDNNGIKGLKVYRPGDMDQAISDFRRDGFVVIADVLTPDQVDFLAKGCAEVAAEIMAADTGQSGNRGSGRYSFGGGSLTRSQLHRPEWQMMLSIPFVDQIMTAIFGSEDYILRAASGDFCLPGTTEYQRLHSDMGNFVDKKTTKFSSYVDPRGRTLANDLPTPYIAVNFLPQDVTPLNGPTRQIPGTHHSHAAIPGIKDEPEWMRLSTVCPAPAGAIMIRDVRAWHGGTPNVSDAIRAIPNLELYAPWFREPMVPGITYQDYKQLPERVQQIVKYSVADSSEELKVGPTLFAP